MRGGTKTGGKEAGAGPSFFDSAEAEDPFAQLECELDSWEGARRGASGDNEGRVGNGKGQGRAAVVLKLAEVVGPPSWWEDKRIGSRRRSGSPTDSNATATEEIVRMEAGRRAPSELDEQEQKEVAGTALTARSQGGRVGSPLGRQTSGLSQEGRVPNGLERDIRRGGRARVQK